MLLCSKVDYTFPRFLKYANIHISAFFFFISLRFHNHRHRNSIFCQSGINNFPVLHHQSSDIFDKALISRSRRNELDVFHKVPAVLMTEAKKP